MQVHMCVHTQSIHVCTDARVPICVFTYIHIPAYTQHLRCTDGRRMSNTNSPTPTPSHTDRDYDLWLRLGFPSSSSPSALSSSSEGGESKSKDEKEKGAAEGRAGLSPTITEGGQEGASQEEKGRSRQKGAWRMAVVPAPCTLLRRHGGNESTRRKGEQVCCVCVFWWKGGDVYAWTWSERVVVLYTCTESE